MADLLIRDVRVVPFRSRGELARLRASHHSVVSQGSRAGGDMSQAGCRDSTWFDARRASETDQLAVSSGWSGNHSAGVPRDSPEPVDVRIVEGMVSDVGVGLDWRGEDVVEAEGAFAIPGLWDAHAHLDLEAARAACLDMKATSSPDEALALVARAIRGISPSDGAAPILGFGHRLSEWSRVPTVAELDAVAGDVPAVLISGDAHCGWANSAALRSLGFPGATVTDPGQPLREDPWFAFLSRLDEIPGARELGESGHRRVLMDMLARGVTGVVDMSWGRKADEWPRRLRALARGSGEGSSDGHSSWDVFPRIHVAVYRDMLDRRIDEGLRSGLPMPGSPLAGDGRPVVTQGPLKVIADGSMGTASAHMCDPYPAALGLDHPHGTANITGAELAELMAHATRNGFDMAVHAIGDAAVNDVAAAFANSGARGRMEHAQLLPTDAATAGHGALSRLVACGIELSVQPAHLVDDWASVGRVWPGLETRAYAFADMMAAGALLHMGSDAPVAPLDPWLAMSAAVGRETPDGHVWSIEQRLTAEEALAASVDGAPPIRPGSYGDLVLLSRNPLTLSAADLREVRPLAVIVAGRLAPVPNSSE